MEYVPLSLNSYRQGLIGGVRITIGFVNAVGGRPRVSRSWKIGQWKCLRTGNWGYFLELRGSKWQEDGEKYMMSRFIFVLFAKYYLFSSSYNLPWRLRGECRYSSTLSLTSALDGEWVVSATPRPLHLRENTRYPLFIRLSEPQGRSGRRGKLRPIGVRVPNRPTHSKSLYWLRYSGPQQIILEQTNQMYDGPDM
jgi:hypothetical protein